jgi:hypothetical protein
MITRTGDTGAILEKVSTNLSRFVAAGYHYRDCMNDDNGNLKGSNVIFSHPIFRRAMSVIMWMTLTALGLLVCVIVIGVGGYQIPFWPSDTEVSFEEPFSNFIGQEFLVIGEVTALTWNDFPDKEKILVVSLTSPPGASNRFVSHRIPLQQRQRVLIQSAWKSLSLFEFTYYYQVSVPGAGLPEGVPIQLDIGSDGIPNPLYYELDQSNNGNQADGIKLGASRIGLYHIVPARRSRLPLSVMSRNYINSGTELGQ